MAILENTKIRRSIPQPIWFLFFSAIFLLGIYMRIESGTGTTVIIPLRADAGMYYDYAFNLRYRHTYSSQAGDMKMDGAPVTPDAIRPPGYPLFLTFFVNTNATERILKRIVDCQIIISSLSILLSFFFFQTFLPKWGAMIATLLVSLSPHLIVSNSYILTETLFCFFLLLLAFTVKGFVSRPGLGSAGIIGITIGAANLIRNSLQFFPFFMAVFIIYYYGMKKGWRFCVAMFVGFLIITLPWIARNLITLNAPTDKTLTINFLHHGMYPDFTFNNIPESFGFPYRFDPRSEEIRKNIPSVLKEIQRRFTDEPLSHMKWFFLKKPFVFWGWNQIQGIGDAFGYPVSESPYFSSPFFQKTHRLMHSLHWKLVVLCFLGCMMVWLPLSQFDLSSEAIINVRFVSTLLLYFIGLHIVGAPFPRYSIPLRPFLYGMAVFVIYLMGMSIRKYLFRKKAALLV